MKQSCPQTHENRGLILAIASVFCFTATSLLLSHLHTAYGIDGWVASAYRGIAGLLVILAMQSRTGQIRLHRILSNRLLFLRGLVGGATIPVYYLSIMELGPGRAGMIGGSYPLFGAIFAMLLLNEGLTRSYFIHIAVALLGLVLVFADNGLEASKPAFDALAICGAAAGGLCVVMIRHLRHSESTSNIFASQCIFTLLIGGCTAGSHFFISDPLALGLTLLASLTVVGGQLCITEALRHVNVAKGATLQMLTPALTVLCSAGLLGEHFSLFELLGGGAILYASYRIATSRT